jgi:Na+/melibiose symporter-like transporter
MNANSTISERDILITIRYCLKRIADNKQRSLRGLLFNLGFFVAYICLMLILVWVHKGDSGFSYFFKHLTEQPVYLQVIAFFALCWCIALILHIVLFFRSWQTGVNANTLQNALKYIEKKQQELMPVAAYPEINPNNDNNSDKN